MKRFIEYSDVFSFDFESTDNIQRDINDLKERLSDELNHFLDLGFSDAFLFVMSETYNEGEVKVCVKSFAMDVNLNSLKSIEAFMRQIIGTLKYSDNYELELAYHLTSRDLILPNFDGVFATYTVCKSLIDYIFHLSNYPSALSDCIIREELSKFVILTPNSDYIIRCKNGNSFESKLVNEEVLILPDFDESDDDDLVLPSFDEEMLFD